MSAPDASAQERVTQLIKERRARLRKWFARRLPVGQNAAKDPDDLMQETSLRAWLGAARLRSAQPGSAWAWIMKIAERVLLDAVRSAQAHGRTSAPAGRKEHVVSLSDALDIVVPSNGAGAEFERIADALDIAFNSLTPSRRAVLELHYVDGLSYKEIAQQLGKRERAIRALVTHAREQLRQRFAAAFKRRRRTSAVCEDRH